jgi:hypothetical protein
MLLSKRNSWLHPITDFPSAKLDRVAWASLLTDAWVPLVVPVELKTLGRKKEML